MNRERDLQEAVIELAKTLRWTVGHFSDSRREVKPGVFVGDKLAAGMPDLVLVRERYVWKAEHFDEITRVLQAKCPPWELRPAWIPSTLWQLS